MYKIMKTQERYPYDETLDVPYIIFRKVGSNSFYANSSCICATKKIITIRKEYVVFDYTADTGIKMSDVILINCNYHEGIISLIVQDIRSQRVFTLDHCIEPPESDCKWVLIDLNYFIDKMNIKAIKSYCDGCNDQKKKHQMEMNHKSSQDDLLEFEF